MQFAVCRCHPRGQAGAAIVEMILAGVACGGNRQNQTVSIGNCVASELPALADPSLMPSLDLVRSVVGDNRRFAPETLLRGNSNGTDDDRLLQ